MFKRLSTTLICTFVIALPVALATSVAHAEPEVSGDDGADSQGYDAIVDQLSREQNARAATSRARQTSKVEENSFDTIWMHGGVGFANYIESLKFEDGTTTTLNQKGIQAALGIDLFSPNWMAEGTARSFAEDGDGKVRSSVHEFELKILNKDRFGTRFGYRAGLGFTGLYL
jgi:hypothetical protein